MKENGGVSEKRESNSETTFSVEDDEHQEITDLFASRPSCKGLIPPAAKRDEQSKVKLDKKEHASNLLGLVFGCRSNAI